MGSTESLSVLKLNAKFSNLFPFSCSVAGTNCVNISPLGTLFACLFI